jgi:hypothetical protein
MSNHLSVLMNKIKLYVPLLFFVFFVLAFNSAAQTKRKNALPRVGAIKNYEATGMMTGCGNLYFKFPNKSDEAKNYVYLARAEGEGAWMNLNGRDTRLTLLKTTSWRKGDRVTKWRYDYRMGTTRISVYIEFNNDEDFSLDMKIILKKGRSTRTIKAVGYSDC